MKVSDAYPSNYIKAIDLDGRTAELTIRNVTMEDLGNDRKPVAHFSDAKKGLVLNVTNASAVAAEFGDDMDAWAGHKIELYGTPVTFQGKTVDAIRVRPVREKPAAKDGVPFDDALDL